jgi:hypothetical protein
MKDDEYYNARVALHDAPPSTHKLQVGVQQQVKGLWLADLKAAYDCSNPSGPIATQQQALCLHCVRPLSSTSNILCFNATLNFTFESNLSCSHLHSNTQCVCW